MQAVRRSSRPALVTALIETFGFSPWLATAVALFLFTLGAAALVWLWLSAPPRTLTIASGPPDSSFHRHAVKYQEELATHGVTLKIVQTEGSSDNLKRLLTPNSGIDIGFVQDGLVDAEHPPEGVVSLGSIAYQPLFVFYRSATKIARLSELGGKRLGIGPVGSGTRMLATALLEANHIAGAPTVLLDEAAENASSDLLQGKVDAIFLMGDSAPRETLRALLRADGVQLYSFVQADAYVRRNAYLNKIVLPRGGIDVGLDLPPQDVTLIGPTVELVARKSFNSALSDLVLSVAQPYHGKPSLIQKRGEFPAPLERDFPLSDDAVRYYKSGKGLAYRLIHNFWLASLTNRLLVAIVPIVLVLIPAFRFFPLLYRWSVQLRIYRCYRPLLRIERDAEVPLSLDRANELLRRLDDVEVEANKLKVPASFAYQFYDLQGHIAFVRSRLRAAADMSA